MKEIIEKYVKLLFYKKFKLNATDIISKMYVEKGILQEVESADHKKKKEKRYCATNLMEINTDDIHLVENSDTVTSFTNMMNDSYS